MPNWVYTNMWVHGERSALDAFAQKAARPYKTYFQSSLSKEVQEELYWSPLCFWNFVEPEDKDVYFQSASGETMNDPKNWYQWNVNNWGTKWDATDVHLDDEGYALNYLFKTAWSPAEAAFTAMLRQHPDLHFTWRCVEEQGWGVEYESWNNDLMVTKEWDVPDSHAEWISTDQECGRCMWADLGIDEDLYEDCPQSISQVNA